jgi:hypothetical protein
MEISVKDAGLWDQLPVAERKADVVYSQSPFGTGTLASAGPDCQVSMLVEETKNDSLSGAPGFEISLTSLRVTPAVSPSLAVDEMTPSYR